MTTTQGVYLLLLFNGMCLADNEQMPVLWFLAELDPTGNRTYDLPHSRRAHQPYYHREGFFGLDIISYNRFALQ